MKFLETRTEIAKAINFKQYPTIRIDVSKTDDYGIVGTHVLVDNGTFRTGEPYFVRATIRAFRDEGYLKFKSYGSCLHADFTYFDMEKILDYANVPVVKPDQEILVWPGGQREAPGLQAGSSQDRRSGGPSLSDPLDPGEVHGPGHGGGRLMPRYPKNHKDVEYYVRGRKRRVSGSTVATERFLVMVHQDHPDATISQLREIITDKTKYILCPEGLAVLDDHIKAGYGDHIPNWR